MDTETADQKLKKLDLILVSCLLFDIVNVVLYVHSLINYSFLHILTIFCIGFANILFAFLVYLRIRDPNYKLLYGEEGVSQSRYYVKTMFKGALFIALDFALVTVLLWICSIMFSGSRGFVQQESPMPGHSFTSCAQAICRLTFPLKATAEST